MAWLLDAQRLGRWCLGALQQAGLQPLTHLFHADTAGQQGATAGAVIMVLVPSSHLLLRTWPAERGVTVDLYATNDTGVAPEVARALVDALSAHFQPAWTEQRSLDRGDGQ